MKAGTQRRVTAEIAPSAPTPTRAARSSSGSVGGAQLAHAAVGEDQLDRLDLGGDVAQPRAGAVGAGRDRAGDRLAVDVAEVLHRQPEPVQLLVEVGEDRPAPDPDQAGGGVGVEHAAQRLDPDQRAVGQRRLGEGVPGAGDAHLAPRRGGRADRLGQLLASARAGRSPPAGTTGPRPSCARSSSPLAYNLSPSAGRGRGRRRRTRWA